jgi:uncharacterized protein YjbJ (UPF0337 family)
VAKDLHDQGAEDSARGKADQIKGHVKDAAGGLTGDSDLQAEGKLDQLKGKTEDALGKGERKIDRSLNDDR